MASQNEITVELNEKDFEKAMQTLTDMYESLNTRYLKNTLKRKAKPITNQMKMMSPSIRLKKVIGASTAKKRTKGRTSVKLGVIKNDRSMFPKFSSFALASVLEYGTKERFKKVKSAGVTTGRISTGEMPKDEFLRPAYDNNITGVLDDFEKTITKRVIKKAK